jgi:hypothetical protein
MKTKKKTNAEDARQALKMAVNTMITNREADDKPVTLTELLAMADNNFEALQNK